MEEPICFVVEGEAEQVIDNGPSKEHIELSEEEEHIVQMTKMMKMTKMEMKRKKMNLINYNVG